MQDYDLAAYLGDTDTTAEQREALNEALKQIAATYPVADDYQAENLEAGSGAAQVVLGDATLDALAQEWATQRENERRARFQLHGAIIASLQAGMSESEAVRVSGISRPTVRKLVGK